MVKVKQADALPLTAARRILSSL